MKREIKFKAWDSEKKRMSKPFFIGDYALIWNDGDMDMPIQFASAKSERFSFLQFTGLQDKNGVDIFEGDKILHNKNIFIVKYSENQKVLLLRVENDEGKNWRSLEWLSNVSKYCEVIGNIHEPNNH